MNMLDLTTLRKGSTQRFSSWDVSGRNGDAWSIPARSSRVLADIKGPGVINHIWMTQGRSYRECLIKITWDDAPQPSVLCPLGDFFGLGHGMVNSYQSLLFTASTWANNQFNEGCALNSYAAMPFRKRAVIELVNDTDAVHSQYFYVDYERVSARDLDKRGYFHAEFRRACPFLGWAPEMLVNTPPTNVPNTGREAWKQNYVILETKGRGHYLGCNLSVTNIQGSWWGEGDDMIWVDGYKWPPDLHGTGSEDYLNQAWGMQPNAFLRNGSSLHENNTGGYQTSYVHHIDNPVRFTKDIKVTIEHGHANHLGNEMSSVAYWYAEKPTRVVDVPPVAKRLRVPKVNDEWVIPEEMRWTGKPVVIDQAVLKQARADYAELFKTRISERYSDFIEAGWMVSELFQAKDIAKVPYRGMNDKVGWVKVPRQMNHLIQVHGVRGGDGLVYLARKVRVAKAGKWNLHVGHDGGARVFVDRKPVGCTPGTINPAPHTRTTAPVSLAAGEHEIVVVLDRSGGMGWGAFVSFELPAGCDYSDRKVKFPEPV
ncbi:MAG: glycoside hydrolase family 172 protein [bacterium]